MQLFPLRSCHCSCSFTCRNNICCTSEFGKSHWVIANAVESWSLIYVIYIYCIIQYRLHIEIVLFLLALNRRPHASLTVRVAVVQLLDLKQPQGPGSVTACLAGGGWHSEMLIPFSEQPRKQMAIFQLHIVADWDNCSNKQNWQVHFTKQRRKQPCHKKDTLSP